LNIYINEGTDNPVEYDALFLYHGHESPTDMKSLNYFLKDGKSFQKLADKAHDLHKILTSNHKLVFSLDWKSPMYGSLIKSRIKPEFENLFSNIDFEKMDFMLSNRTIIDAEKLDELDVFNSIVLGDSHSASCYTKEDNNTLVNRNDFKTLHGATRIGFDKLLTPNMIHDIAQGELKLIAYFGNIDIRHHLARTDDPHAATKSLVADYVAEILNLSGTHPVVIIEPLPIEDESRILPKSGWYKGTPFYGDWAVRNGIRNVFIDELIKYSKKYNFEVREWPSHFYDTEGRLRFDVMEKPRSVHLSPTEYLWKE